MSYEKICQVCSQSFETDDAEMCYCVECWNEYLSEQLNKRFYSITEDVIKEFCDELID